MVPFLTMFGHFFGSRDRRNVQGVFMGVLVCIRDALKVSCRSSKFAVFNFCVWFNFSLYFSKSLMHPGSLQISRFGRRGFVLYFMSLQASINCRWNCCYTFYCHFKSPILIKYFVPKHPAHERHPCMEYSPKIPGWNKNPNTFPTKKFCSFFQPYRYSCKQAI